MRYTAKFFKESMPEWKRKKDPLNCRFCIRPLSFWGSAFCANHGITANMVSYFSSIVAIFSCIFFLVNDRTINIIGAVLINVWLWLDCVDGNIARSVKKEPFGEFADALSGYILVAFMCISFGVYVYRNGGLISESGKAIFIVLGAFASTFDTLTRLANQKYKNTETSLLPGCCNAQNNVVNREQSNITFLLDHVAESMGVGGWLPHFILLAVIINCMDLIVIYCFLFHGAFFVFGTLMNVQKAIRNQKIIQKEESLNDKKIDESIV